MAPEPSFEQWRDTGRYFEHHGHPIFYQLGGSRGEGPALLLIHGFPTASWDWHRIWPALCDAFPRVIAADMIGLGFSAKPRRYPYSLRDQADLHEALLRSLGVRAYHVLAHDIGDGVAQELLARRLERQHSPELRSPQPLSICFLNGALVPDTHRPRPIQKLLAMPFGPVVAALMNERGFRRSFSALFGPKTQPGAAELSEFWRLIEHNQGRRVLHDLMGYMAERRRFNERWVGALKNADVPLRVIDGAVDPIVGAHMVERYCEVVPRPDVVVLQDIGHFPQLEAPDAVLKAFVEHHARVVRAAA